jgi:hypothetical protein
MGQMNGQEVRNGIEQALGQAGGQVDGE